MEGCTYRDWIGAPERASLVAQLVKNLPARQETWVRSLGCEDPLEKGMATHSSILAWRIPWTVQSIRWHRVRQDRAAFILLHFQSPREQSGSGLWGRGLESGVRVWVGAEAGQVVWGQEQEGCCTPSKMRNLYPKLGWNP